MAEERWSEFGLIDRFFRHIENPRENRLIKGIGDDAAILDVSAQGVHLITYDMMIEDVHFRTSWMSPYDLARKLTKVNLSDIAAMGGTPDDALLGIALPDTLPSGWLKAFSEGLHQTFSHYGLSLIGGDTSRSPGPIVAAMTLLGTCPHHDPILRHSPHPGDTLYVSGFLGDAALGLLCLEEEGKKSFPKNEHTAYLVRRHLNPTPRIELGQAIARQHLATAMIDISDGLVGDLEHLLEHVPLGAVIEFDAIPLSPSFSEVAPRMHPQPAHLAITGGEDYELLLASPHNSRHLQEIAPSIARQLTPIGTITETPGIAILKNGAPLALEANGYRHQFLLKGPS